METWIQEEIKKIKDLQHEIHVHRNNHKNDSRYGDNIHIWQNVCLSFLSKVCEEGNTDLEKVKSIEFTGNTYCLYDAYDRAQPLVNCMIANIEKQEIKMTSTSANQNNKVFLVHGHDHVMLLEVKDFISSIGLEPVILNDKTNKGQTVIEKLEDNSDVGYAIVLLSPCDKGCAKRAKELKHRARQNVILELGYFYGKLGRGRVCTLLKKSVEIPSDFTGIVYTAFDTKKQWKVSLAKELMAAGYKIDTDQVILSMHY